jgi:SAM-dependent methyltransferase
MTGAASRPLGSARTPAHNENSLEHDRIRAVYRYYDSSARQQRKRDVGNRGVCRNAEGRWAFLRRALLAHQLPDGFSVLDIGCGTGEDLRRLAADFANLRPALHGADLLPDRIAEARTTVPSATLHVCGAEQLPYDNGYFDVVIAATVFSSILDEGLAHAVAREVSRVTAVGGIILCYDIRYPNFWNPHTTAIGLRKLRQLFPATSMRLSSVTLLPPLARRLGCITGVAYPILHAMPFLRSHHVAEIQSCRSGTHTMAGPAATKGSWHQPAEKHAEVRPSIGNHRRS